MGFDYALIHLVFTIPPAAALSIILYPLLTKIDLYKTFFLITVAVIYTIPWDSYLIRTEVWSYPADGVLGPTAFSIPIEELFFFVIQTYITSLLYILVNRPTVYVTCLLDDTDANWEDPDHIGRRKRIGQIFFLCFTVSSYYLFSLPSAKGTYLALICVWAGPVLLALWCFAYQLLLTLPRSKTWLPILLPTIYLWIVDTIALSRGTWSIQQQTTTGIKIWPGLEMEEAVFFLVTNTLVVFGLAAFENAVAVIEAFPDIYPRVPALPNPRLLLSALFLSPSRYDVDRIYGIRKAVQKLSAKSRSFTLASSAFSGRLRLDLIILYAFCRVGDDLVDNASSTEEAERWISHLHHFLDFSYSSNPTSTKSLNVLSSFPPDTSAILSLLPTRYLPLEPLLSLLEGFRSDLAFIRLREDAIENREAQFPIKTSEELEVYASRVASTVAVMCLHLVYYHDPSRRQDQDHVVFNSIQTRCLAAGAKMGIALQYTNIARDVFVDAEDGRCYLPTDWLLERGLVPQQVIRTYGKAEPVAHVRRRVLGDAFSLYQQNRGPIENLPKYARAGIRVAVESYMEIGRILKERIAAGIPLDSPASSGRRHRATVPRLRRLLVGWQALTSPTSRVVADKQG